MAKTGKDWKSYDGYEVCEGEILVPQLVDPDYAWSIGAVMENLRTWTVAGVRFIVMFVPVPVDMAGECWKAFYSAVNELLDDRLGPARRGRQTVSLDALLEKDYLPADAVPSSESIVMEGILLDEMISALGMKNPLYADVIRLGYRGLDRKEVVDRLPVRKSRRYDLYRRCMEEAEGWLCGNDENGKVYVLSKKIKRLSGGKLL